MANLDFGSFDLSGIFGGPKKLDKEENSFFDKFSFSLDTKSGNETFGSEELLSTLAASKAGSIDFKTSNELIKMLSQPKPLIDVPFK